MRINFLVIGSNSFSGAYFTRFLLEKGHGVLGVSRSPEPIAVMLPYKWLPSSENFLFRQFDINHQLEELIAITNEFKPQYIVNFAAQGMVAQSWDSPQDWYQTNVVAQVKLHDQLRKLSFLKRYVHVSTPEVYGNTDGWIKERFQFSPSTPYAVSRAACDLHLMTYFRAYQFPVCITRAANVYGPGQQVYRIIPRAMLCARLRKTIHLHGGGHSVRSFIHMSDVSEATYRVAIRGVSGESYHISTPDTISIRGLVERICEMTGAQFDDLAVVSEDRLGKDQAYLLDSSKICSNLNWSHQITLDDGLRETLAWIDANLDALKDLPSDYVHKS